MKKTKTTLLKGVALLLAALMTFGDPVSAMAAVPEAGVTNEAAVTDAADADYSNDAIETDAEGIETEEDDYELPDEAKQALRESASDFDTIMDSDISDLPEEVIFKLGDGEEPETPSTTEPDKPVTVKEVKASDYEAVRYASRVLVKNKTTLTGDENDLFAVLVLKAENNKRLFYATRVPVGGSRILYSCYDPDYNEKAINTSDDYELWLSWAGETKKDSEGNIIEEPDPYIGYAAQYDEETFVEKKDTNGNIIYDVNIGGKFDLPSSNITPEPAIADVDWQNGADIKFKAAVQKNMTIKFSWSPNTKDEKQKTYKKYQLYELVPDATNEVTGYKEKEERIWPVTDSKSNKKSYVLKEGVLKDNKINSSMIYLLKCYDATDALVGQYVTTLAPYVFRFQSGSDTGMFDYMFTQSNSSSDFVYQMGIASKNKEYDAVKVPTGFQEKWTSVISNSYSEVFEEGEYPVNKKTNVNVLQTSYTNEEPEILLANQYFGRIQTVANVGKLRIVSTPSNVLSCKAGPERCYVINAAGVKYDAADAKKDNAENFKRANAYINYFFGDEEATIDQSIFIHHDNQNVDAKSGMIFFIGPSDDNLARIKSFDLLRCTTKNGVYKKVKTYKKPEGSTPKKGDTIFKCNVEGLDGFNVYALQYTSFPYDQQYYYAVRAVSTVKSVTGGLGMGHMFEPKFETIQQAYALDIDASSIFITWKHDDCVKEYWIYRSDSGNDVRGGKAVQAEYIGKVAGKSFKKTTDTYEDEDGKTITETYAYHSYTDKKVEANRWYFYYVRPVFNTKEAKNDSTKYMEYCSEKYPAKASATFTAIKNFKVSNFATEKVKASFTQALNINEYRIWRVSVPQNVTKVTANMKPDVFSKKDPNVSYEDFIDEVNNWTDAQWKEFFKENGGWEWYDTIRTKGNSKKAYTSKDPLAKVEVGKYYFYMIQPVSNQNGRSIGTVLSYSSRIQNLPLPVENVKAKYTGSGVSLTWNLNENDKNNSNLSVQIKYDGAWHNASRGGYYDDTLPRGGQRTYYVRVRYGNTSYYSSEKSITYSLPVGIELNKSGGDGEFKDNVLTLEYDETNKVGQSATMSARAYLNNNETAAYNTIEYSYNTDKFEITGSGNNFTVKAKKAGSENVTVTLTCAGIKKTFKVKVVKKSTQQ